MPGDVRQGVLLKQASTLATGDNKDRWVAPFDGTIVSANVVLGTAADADVVYNVKKNGSLIWTTDANRPKVLTGATSGSAAGKPDVASFVKGDVLGLTAVAIGSSDKGADAFVALGIAVRA